MDNQSKRIADLVIELIGAMKVELTPTGLKVEDILSVVDDAIIPYKEEMQERIGGLMETVVNLGEAFKEIDTDDLESRISDLEGADEPDIEDEIDRHLSSWKFKTQLSEVVDEAIDKTEMASDIRDDIKDDISWLLDDDDFKRAVQLVVQKEIKNAIEVLVAHWADN
jgi:phosphoenolpyruvate synthase/pyruvate phosphate dikinase